jgi:hypothetical protein
VNWCGRQELNLHCTGFEAVASADWATTAYPWRDSNAHFRGFRPRASAVGLHGRKWCAEQDSNPHRIGSKPIASTSWATGAWCSPQASILPSRLTKAVSCRMNEESELVPLRGIEPRSAIYKTAASPQCFKGLVLTGWIEHSTFVLRERCSAV